MATCQDGGTRFSIWQAGGPSGTAFTADGWPHDRHAALRRDRSRVGDLVVLHGAHLLGPQRCHGNRFAVERYELDFVSLALFMHQHDRPDVAGCETVFREIARQHRYVEFIDHVRLAPDANGLEITKVAAAVQDSSDLDAIRRGTKKDHVHTD